MAESLRKSEHLKSWQERKGLCTHEILSTLTLDVDDLELLMGRLAPRPESVSDAQLEDAAEYLKKFPKPGGQTGHCELDLSTIMQMGIDGLLEDIQRRADASEGEQAATYRSFIQALSGLSIMIEHAAECGEGAIQGGFPERQEELAEMAEICRRIAHHPPNSFRDAIQLLWLVLLGVQHGEEVWLIGPGHLDRTLFPFYERDLREGKITRDDALLLIESLYILINEFVPDHLAVPVMVGGVDPEGKDVTNDLSYLCLEALRRTRLIYPTVGICWHEGTPRELLDLGIRLIGEGISNPAFFGDATIQKGLKALGTPPEQACNYINSTCVEITPVGSSNVWVASPYFNTCALLLEETSLQAESSALSFESFLNGYRERLSNVVAEGVEVQNRLRDERQRHGRKPLQSVFTRDCIARGRDIDDGGAIYNWIECSFVGLANLADSLLVIREEIFNRRRMSFAELKAILDANYEGHEETRQRFLKSHVKYGQDDPEVDGIVSEITRIFVDECRKHKVKPDLSHFVPGTFVWEMHSHFGLVTGATPDGRLARSALADGGGPAQGRESKGPTAAILSTTSWDHSPMIGGLAFNMRFNKSMFSNDGGYDRLRDLVLTYLRRGGFEVQVNVVDAEVLREAREAPEKYRDLIVRIGGYTGYFTQLPSGLQEEIIMRTEYEGE